MAGDNFIGFAPIAGKSSISTVIRLISSAGAGITGKLATNLTAYYYRQGASASTSITLSDLANLNSAYSSGGVKEIDATHIPGAYRLDLPDAAIATGVDWVVLGVTCSGAVDYEERFTLSDAIPGVAAGASTGLPLAVDSSGRVDVLKINGTSQTARDIGASVLLSSGSGTGQLDFTSGVVKANVTQWLAQTVQAAVNGFPKVDLTYVLGTILSESAGAGALAASIIKFFNKTSPTGTINSIPDAVAGASSGIAIVGSNMGTASSVTGNVGGNVVGSVASVTAGVTVSTNNDKTGYGLSSAAVQAVWDALASALSTSASIGKLLVDNINATISSRQATLTSTENNAIADATLDRASGIETSYTLRQSLKLILSAAVGKLSGAATTTIVIRDVNDTKDRITATVDSNGNRSAVTKDVS